MTDDLAPMTDDLAPMTDDRWPSTDTGHVFSGRCARLGAMKFLAGFAAFLSFSLVACAQKDSTTVQAEKPHDATESRAAEPIRVAKAEKPEPKPAPSPAKPTCKSVPFAGSVDLAEASGATFVAGSSPFLMVVGDSGTHGAYVLLDPDTGKELEQGQLPMTKAASDDLEGLSVMDDTIYAITSSGWMREWKREGKGFRETTETYAVAPLDKRELVCKSARKTNCAQNYEGLCLLPKSPASGCVGFAAAKKTGTLWCLINDEKGRLAIDSTRSIVVAKPEALTGCHFDERGRLWTGNNLFGGNQISVIEGWQDPKKAKIVSVGMHGLGFSEAIATGPGDHVYRFSDTASKPSLMGKYLCR